MLKVCANVFFLALSLYFGNYLISMGLKPCHDDLHDHDDQDAQLKVALFREYGHMDLTILPFSRSCYTPF